jgi:hypothetical protein
VQRTPERPFTKGHEEAMAEAASSPAITDWGVPDPRDASAYPEPTLTTPMTTWAWEFLRRSDDYRRRWLQLNVSRGVKEVSEMHQGRATRWRSATEILREEFRIYAGTAAGANSTLDPRLAEPPLFEGAEIVVEVAVQSDPVKPPKVLIEFDATLPIEPQLDGARRLLHQRAKARPVWRSARPQIDKLARYLRLLDFDAEVAADEEIGEYLFPNFSGDQLRDAIRTNAQQARRWQSDYLILALHLPAAS